MRYDYHEQKISAIRKISVISGSNPCPEPRFTGF